MVAAPGREVKTLLADLTCQHRKDYKPEVAAPVVLIRTGDRSVRAYTQSPSTGLRHGPGGAAATPTPLDLAPLPARPSTPASTAYRLRPAD